MHARHYATGEPLELTLAAGRITAVRPSTAAPTCWVAPSFFDPQINGALGVGFVAPTLTADGVRRVAAECRRHGIGGFLPTLITAGFDALRHGFATLAAARAADPDLARAIPGYHLEGPYLSGEDGPRGAHPRVHVRDPDWDEFRRLQDAADGRILMVTVAPERPGAIPFVEHLSAAGVVVAIGHTAATTEQLRAAAAAGARTSTHLGNGAHALLPRHPNYIWDQLADDRLWMSVIPDGHHLPAAVVKCLVRAKGVARTLVTCDASSLAGMPPGRYREWGTDLEVLPSGKVVLAGTPYLAGSGHFTDRCVGTLVRDAGVSLAEAVDMAAVRPRELLGLPVPRLAVGEDVVVFDWEPGGELIVREC
jgi:N-acetylglucosamine-6-phosphate deacetylase